MVKPGKSSNGARGDTFSLEPQLLLCDCPEGQNAIRPARSLGDPTCTQKNSDLVGNQKTPPAAARVADRADERRKDDAELQGDGMETRIASKTINRTAGIKAS